MCSPGNEGPHRRWMTAVDQNDAESFLASIVFLYIPYVMYWKCHLFSSSNNVRAKRRVLPAYSEVHNIHMQYKLNYIPKSDDESYRIGARKKRTGHVNFVHWICHHHPTSVSLLCLYVCFACSCTHRRTSALQVAPQDSYM